MAETKPITTDDKEAPVRDNRPLRTVEQTINEPLPEPTPTQAELDAIMLGEAPEVDPPPEGETQEQRAKREEEQRKKREEKQQREAKAAANQAGYQTR